MSHQQVITAGQAKFAFDLLREVVTKNKEEEANNSVVISPISISIALGMVLLGAKNKTAEEIQRALAKNVDIDEIHKHFSSLLHFIKNDNFNNNKAALKMANKIYFANDLDILDSFKKGIQKNYDGNFELADFGGEAIYEEINKFVAFSTDNEIQDFIKPGIFTDLTKLVLINAIYFEKKWSSSFQLCSSKSKFYSEPNITTEISMMENCNYCRYFENEKYQFLELCYEGRECFSMFLLLPREQFGLSKIIKSNDDIATKILDLMSIENFQNGKIIIPKFEINSSFNLNESLKNLNIIDAFDNADFSGTTKEYIFISKILHKAIIKVSEDGTKAVAATLDEDELLSYDEPSEEIPFEFIADHPFLYLIADKQKNIYFIGTFYN